MRKRLSDKFRTALLYLRCSRAFPNRQISRGGAKNSSDSLSAPAPVHGAAAGRSGGNRLSDGQRRAPVGSGAESRPASQSTDATNTQARRRKCALAGFGPPKDVRSADDVRQRCAAAGRSAGSRGRQTAPHDRIRTGTHGAGDECGGGAEPHGGSRTDTGGCGGNVRRKPRPANGAARPHPHRDAWRGARMRGGAEPHGGSRTPEAAAGKSAGSRSRQTAPHDPIRTGTHGAGDECGGGLNRTAAPGIGGGPHAPTALRTTTVGITDRRGDT